MATTVALALGAPVSAGPQPQPCQKDGEQITFRFPIRTGRVSLDVDGNGVVRVKLDGRLQDCGGATNDEIEQVLVLSGPLPGRNVVVMRTLPSRRPGYISIDLGGGKRDTVVVRGTPKKDAISTGTAGSGNRMAAVADVDGDRIADAELRSVETLRAQPGAGNDEVTGRPTVPAKAPAASSGPSPDPARIRMMVRGGPGNDRMTGGNAGDRLAGGPGNDVLEGGRGRDRLDGGPGPNDRCDGGPGRDRERGCE